MKLFLIFYFVFAALVDPWIDGAMEFNAIKHKDSQVVSFSVQQFEIPHFEFTSEHRDHSHDSCPEDCHDHTCHLGHCGFLVSANLFHLHSAKGSAFIDYRQFVPTAYILGLKRPPKFLS